MHLITRFFQVSAAAAAQALARGLRAAMPTAACVLVPVADGGEGTLDVLLATRAGELRRCTVRGPSGARPTARYALLENGPTAAIEMAEASGLGRLPAAMRDPCARAASAPVNWCATRRRGARRVVARSAWCDQRGGAGLLQALGLRLFDVDGHELPSGIGGGALNTVAAYDATALHALLSEVVVELACDVDNPLCGPRGASRVFGPQKGADATTVAQLERGIAHFYDLLEGVEGRVVRDHAGAGAAGGAAAALLLFAQARLRPGIGVVLEALGFAAFLAEADLVITGEGRLDAQTLAGKAPAGVARWARRAGIPVVGVGGMLSADAESRLATCFDALEASVAEPLSLADALAQARRISNAAVNASDTGCAWPRRSQA